MSRFPANPQPTSLAQTSLPLDRDFLADLAATAKSNSYPIWHPFTQARTAPPPQAVVKGRGAYLELADGRTIFDAISSWWVNLHGHCHEEIAQAIYQQATTLEHVIFAGFTHRPALELAELLLAQLPPNFTRVFYSDNGSTAVEVALKMAFQYWRNHGCQTRRSFIAFAGGYHGDTIGAMSAGSGSPFWDPFKPLMFRVDTVSYPDTCENDDQDQVEAREAQTLAELERLVDGNPLGYAGIIIEPLVQGAAGMRMCRPQFMQALAKFARANQLLLIYDEVMTGFGRTGDWFACRKSNTAPDIITLSKGITGGFMPLSVTACSEEIYAAFLAADTAGTTPAEGDRTFYHGHSYTANPLACAAAVASTRLLSNSQTAFQQMETWHRELAAEYLSNCRHLERLRFCGTIFACDLASANGTSYFNAAGPELRRRFLAAGFLIRPLGNTIYLMPPYCSTRADLARAYEAIASTVNS